MGFFNAESKDQIKSAIQMAENMTSGEIRVCVEKTCYINPIDRAGYFFKKLKMDETKHRNGVLIYLASDDRKFSIIGDKGIHSKTGPLFWEDSRDVMRDHLGGARMATHEYCPVDQTSESRRERTNCHDVHTTCYREGRTTCSNERQSCSNYHCTTLQLTRSQQRNMPQLD